MCALVQPTWTKVLLAGMLLGLACASPLGATSVIKPPPLATVLAGYRKAIADPGVDLPQRTTIVGTLAGAGLQGTFRSWTSIDRERLDENLGPRSERTLRIGNRVWFSDENGDVREFTGVFARRERTQRFIASGEFADHPERCTLRGGARLSTGRAYVLDIAPEGGEMETLYLDAQTLLPARLSYDDDDGRTTVDFSDWRSVDGRRYAFLNVTSDGDHAFDITQTTTSVDARAPIPASVFAPLVSRTIEMSAPETVALQYRDGHFYAPVRIADKSFTFLVDTGAQNIVLDRNVARALGLHGVGALEASGATRTGGLQLARVPSLIVGNGGMLSDLVVTTLDLGASTDGAFRIDGVLGYAFFASALVRIDPAARTMTFGPPGSLPSGGERVVLTTDRGFPEATFRLDARLDAPFIIDTGNAAELLLYRPFVEHHGGIVPFSTSSRSSYGIGGATSSYRSSLDEIDIGNSPLYHAETDVMLATRGAFADRFDAGNVGLGLLKNFVMTFDYAHDTMDFERSSAFDDGRSRN